MYYNSYCNTAVKLIKEFDGSAPLQHFLKKYFAANKKFGSKDRKNITNLCYTYFRLGHSLKQLSVEEKILAGIFLTNQSSYDLLDYFKPEWNKNIHLPLQQKLSIIHYPFSITDIFPWKKELSEGIDHEMFCESFLIQPDLFLRIRPGNEKIVKKKLSNNDIEFREIDNSCIALNNSTKIDNVIDINKEAVVQDYSSQETAIFFQSQTANSNPETLITWDCCAGSGGKAIMLFDLNKNINITATDIRKPILINLEKRFKEAGIKKYQSFVADLSIENSKLKTQNFDLIIADVPCSGSGTWSRTPESLLFFSEKEIERFNKLQKNIISNVIPHLKKNGKLIYITCSVFKKENEEVVDFIQSTYHLRLEKMSLLKGYDKKADTMFAASFTV